MRLRDEASHFIAPDQVLSPLVREGHAYWLGKKADRPFPARSDFDPPMEAPKLARHLMLFDVLHDPLDFRYRFIGDLMRERLGHNWVGKRWSEIEFQRAPNPIWLHHQAVVENPVPRFYRPHYQGPDSDFIFIESVILPLGENPERVDMLMVFADFLSRKHL
jgi:hypothetical protein